MSIERAIFSDREWALTLLYTGIFMPSILKHFIRNRQFFPPRQIRLLNKEP